MRLKTFFRSLFVLLGCLHLTGGPLALLQACAWAGMLVTYSQKSGIRQAALDTFSGEKPCELCKKISAAKTQQDKPADAPPPPRFSLRDLMPEMIPSNGLALKKRIPSLYSPPACLAPPAPHGRGADKPPLPPPCAA